MKNLGKHRRVAGKCPTIAELKSIILASESLEGTKELFIQRRKMSAGGKRYVPPLEVEYWRPRPSMKWFRGRVLTQLSTALRTSLLNLLEVKDFHLEDDDLKCVKIKGKQYCLAWIDMERPSLEAAELDMKNCPTRTVFLTPDARDAVMYWVSVKDSPRLKRVYAHDKRNKDFRGKKMWKVGKAAGNVWGMGITLAGLDKKQDLTKYTQRYEYHPSTPRSMFRTYWPQETDRERFGKFGRDLPEATYLAFMGRFKYLDAHYLRFSEDDDAKMFAAHMENITIFQPDEYLMPRRGKDPW